MATENTLRNLMIQEIRDLYDAENQLLKALPKMAKAACSDQLRALIERHLTETEGHVERLERAFGMLGEEPSGKHCAGIAGIIKEGSEMLDGEFRDVVRDAGIIGDAQRAEHYEIGAYGTVIAWARELSEDDVASLLHETLEEEKAADEKLSGLAKTSINCEAAGNGTSPNGSQAESRVSH